MTCDLAVWSHRGVEPALAASSGPFVSEAGLMALVGDGIQRFDLDLCFTLDQHVLVAHPTAIKEALGVRDVFQSRASTLQRSGILPVQKLLALVETMNITVALDLKGAEAEPEQHAAHLLWLSNEVLDRRLERRVWLWADGSTVARRLLRALRPNFSTPRSHLVLVKPVRDRGLASPRSCASSQLQWSDDRLFTILGPSRTCTTGALLAQPWAQQRWGAAGSWRIEGAGADAAGLLVWVVDDARDLAPLVALGVRHVISNAPLALHKAVQSLCAGGRRDVGWGTTARTGASSIEPAG